MDNVLITGANGFLGSHLVDFLVEKKFCVIALIKPSSTPENLSHYLFSNGIKPISEKLITIDPSTQIQTIKKNLIIIRCDLNNKILLEKIIANVKPKYIFHFGAQSKVIPSWEDPEYTIKTNVIGTINTFEAIKKHKIKTKVIVACSSAEYGTSSEIGRSLKETDPLLPIHPYGISKVATELLTRQYFINFGIETVMLRFFNQTGPRKIGDACSDFIIDIAKIELGIKEPMIEVGNLNKYRDITGIKDTLQAIWLAITKGAPGEVYNVCSNRKIFIQDLLNIALSLSSKNIKIIDNTPEKLRLTDEDIILGDNSKIRNELGFQITQSIEDLLKGMYKYWIDYFKKKV